MNEPAPTLPYQSPQSSVPTSQFDICIIGAGAAGLLITEILSRRTALRICLLEAGPDQFRDRTEPFHVENLRREHRGVNEGRVTVFGGATNTWGGGLIRLSAADFEAIDGRPDTAWPIAFESLVPHYQAVEAIFGIIATTDTDANIFFEKPDIRVRRRDIYCLPFRSKNFAHHFGPTLRSRGNVSIRCNTAITDINPGPDGRITSLDVQTVGQPPERIAAPHFVIAAGTVNSNLLAARVLQACGRAPATADLGRYFHDHVSFPIAELKPKSQSAFSRRFGYRFTRHLMLGEHFDLETKGSRIPGAFLHLGFDTSGSSLLRPIRVVLNAIQQRSLKGQQWFTLRELAAMLTGLPKLGFMRYFRGRLFLDSGTKIFATLDLEQLPLRQCDITKRGDAYTATWEVSPEDFATAARYMTECREILTKLQAEADFDIQHLAPDPKADYDGFVKYMGSTLSDTLHGAGGLRMGTAPDSPVDPQLRLGGLKNVYVVSTAVFPRVGTSNPTLTILALGHRLAEQLIELNKAARV